ncbi:unnamed protein product, partial [Polarella glacialis]
GGGGSSSQSALQSDCPRLGPGLRAFVINLARRPDRREHIEALCRELQVDFEIVEAVDGKALAAQPGSTFDVVPAKMLAKAKPKLSATSLPQKASSSASASASAPAQTRPRGFSGLRIRNWRARFMDEGGQPRSQLLQMAEHRLRSSAHTAQGHELWGAVGCSLSHQEVLHRVLEEGVEWALVLEDDAALGAGNTVEGIRKVFDREMKTISQRAPNWQLVYLGGHLSTMVKNKEKKEWLINEHVRTAQQVYMTHAYIIRRSLIPEILAKLQKGLAADAAFVSWSRAAAAAKQCFLFYPKGLLIQPGGADRWKDSDIFVEGEHFKQAAGKLVPGGKYSFISVKGKVRRMDVERQALCLPRPGEAASSGEAEERAAVLFQDIDLQGTLRAVLGPEAPSLQRTVVVLLACAGLEEQVPKLRALRPVLNEVVQGAERIVQMRRAALASAVYCASGDDGWSDRVLRAACQRQQ